jgi:hypothetical protein
MAQLHMRTDDTLLEGFEDNQAVEMYVSVGGQVILLIYKFL